MQKLVIDLPYPNFGNCEGVDFYLVTDIEEYFPEAEIEVKGGDVYNSVKLVSIQDEIKLLGPTHVLELRFGEVKPRITPTKLLKVAWLPLRSTPNFTFEELNYFLNLLKNSNPDKVAILGNEVVKYINCESFSLTNLKDNSTVQIKNREGRYQLHAQYGPIEWGQRQNAPSGEVAILSFGHDSDINSNSLTPIAIFGEMLLKGYPIVHVPRDSSVEWRDFANYVFKTLSRDMAQGFKIFIEDGVVYDTSSPTLRLLFSIDKNYRNIVELGISIADFKPLVKSNLALNEASNTFSPPQSDFNDEKVAVHFGIGVAPQTFLHIDIVCEDLVFSKSSEN
jgi:hypothetical protein